MVYPRRTLDKPAGALARWTSRPGHQDEDAIYRAADGRTETALAALENDGFVLRPVVFSEPREKRAAIDRYPGQVRGLGDMLKDAYRPERYWELSLR